MDDVLIELIGQLFLGLRRRWVIIILGVLALLGSLFLARKGAEGSVIAGTLMAATGLMLIMAGIHFDDGERERGSTTGPDGWQFSDSRQACRIDEDS